MAKAVTLSPPFEFVDLFHVFPLNRCRPSSVFRVGPLITSGGWGIFQPALWRCRVVSAQVLDKRLQRAALTTLNVHPSRRSRVRKARLEDDFWTLHNFVADLVLGRK